MELVIVESPTKAKTIARFLPKKYKVESSYGHVRDLPKSKLGIDLEHEYEPQYIIPKKAQKRVGELKKVAAKANNVILATDEDREGEAIAWHLVQALKLDEANTQRIVFHEITKSAIEHALQKPRQIYSHLVDAQQARRVLDRLVGYKLSPFLWKKVRRGLSAGRVQSVALRLIVDREEEIKAFKPDEYWTIAALLKGGQGEIEAELYRIGEEALPKLGVPDKARADALVKDLERASYKIASLEQKEVQKHPLPPFTTSTLQQTAAKRFGFSAQKTMYLAQHLYENGFITYMRTDSVNLSEEALRGTERWISENLSKDYLHQGARVFKNKSRLAQEAHEAIRPTDPLRTPEIFLTERKSDEKSDRDSARLYELIWRRLIASQMTPARFEAIKAEVEAKTKDKEYGLRASGNMLRFDGFLKIMPMKFEEKELPPLKEGETLELKELRPAQHFTEPPPRFNEASLIKTLEKNGIGRPSTYAAILSVIQNRDYVEKQQGRFYPTEIGSLVNKILSENFAQIVDIQFTAKMEEELDEVAEGKTPWRQVVGKFYEPFAKNLAEKYESVIKEKLIDEKTDQVCEKCGKPMIIKLGRFGKCMACSGFPECKNAKSLKEPPKPTGIKCPKCLASPEPALRDASGELIERRVSKRGRARGKIFWGCNRYPDCDYAVWDDPTKIPPVYDPVKYAEEKAAREARKSAYDKGIKKTAAKIKAKKRDIDEKSELAEETKEEKTES